MSSSTVYRIPRSALKRITQDAEFVERFPCVTIDSQLISHLADVLGLDEPRNESPIVTSKVCDFALFQWSHGFIAGFTSVDPDAIDAAIGGDLTYTNVQLFATGTTQKEVWALLGFLRRAVRDGEVCVELRCGETFS
jgi:hypothetical protein